MCVCGGGYGLRRGALSETRACDNRSGPPKLHVVWLWLFKWSSRLQTGHKWLRFIQSHIIEISCKLSRFQYVVSFSRQRWVPDRVLQFSACLSWVVPRSLAGLLVLHLSDDVVLLGLKITMQILLSGPSSGNRGLSYQHIHHLWTYASLPVPLAKSTPPLHCRLIFCVSELWIVVLPHCNKQMAAQSWVITNPLPEWLVFSQAALIRGRWLSPVFAQALKSSTVLVTHRVCSG